MTRLDFNWSFLKRLKGGKPVVAVAGTALLGCAAIWSVNLIAQTGSPGNQTYTTAFPATESPISQSSAWINGGTTGQQWNNVQTVSSPTNMAEGVGPASTEYSDPTAVLAGTWGPNQTVTVNVYSNGVEDKPSQGYDKEVEIRLRTTIKANSITGYEINCRTPNDSYSYIQIVRWNGGLGNFTSLNIEYGVGCGNGDVFRATINGSTITAYKNGQQILTANDSTYTSGSPGIGFNFGCGSAYNQFGITNFTATDHSAPGASGPNPPTNPSGSPN